MSAAADHALRKYQSVNAHSQVAAADPYRLVQLMLENILQRIAAAKGYLERKEVARKGEQVSKTIRVISALSASLNMEAGGEVANNLRALYEYSSVRLVKANASNDPEGFDEVSRIIRTIKDGWDGIGEEARAAVAGGVR